MEISSVISNIGIGSHNFLLIKHYSYQVFKEERLKPEIFFPSYIRQIYHSFDTSRIIEAYEPFLTCIRESFSSCSINEIHEFLLGCSLYYPFMSIFESYIHTGKCKRMEDILLDEVEYEQKKMVSSILSILINLSLKQPLCFMLSGINMAAPSTIELLTALMKEPENQNIGIIASYNELHSIPPYILPIWEQFYSYCEENGYLKESDTLEDNHTVSYQDFVFNTGSLSSYLIPLHNLYYFLDLRQAEYYLEMLYKIINVEELAIDEELQFEILYYYINVSICMDNMPRSLLLCNKAAMLPCVKLSASVQYQYKYLLGLTYMYSGKLDKAAVYAKECQEIAAGENHDFYCFKGELLELMTRMAGWHNILFCTEDLYVKDSLLAQAESYGYLNHLAHIYIYAYGNNPDLLKSTENIEERLPYYNTGISYIKKTGNEYFLLKAYNNIIMIASTYGYFSTANYYYYKCFSLVKDKDPFEEANIYNGLGYNLSAMGKCSEANTYYNKALQMFHSLDLMDYVGETIYNMAINCIMASDYEEAYDHLNVCLKIIKELKLNSIRVCNISKLFGLLALCCFYRNQFHSCHMFINRCRQFLEHLIDAPAAETSHSPAHDYSICDDDLFLYHFVNSLLSAKELRFQETMDEMKLADKYLQRTGGNQFFILRPFGSEICHLALNSLSISEIMRSLKQAALVKNNLEQKKNLEFLSSWQKLLSFTGKTKEDLIDNAIQAFTNNFNLDKLLFVQYTDDQPIVLFNNTDISYTSEIDTILKNYFKRQRLGFVTSKLMKNYGDYEIITSIFKNLRICSIIGIPFFINDTLQGLLITNILMKENWHSNINKYMLDEGDLTICEFAFRQLLTTIESFDANKKITQMNLALTKSSITDHLTGLLNRDGFYRNIEDMIALAHVKQQALDISMLYIDLDNFKYYNDTFGHNIGDLILKKMAGIFKDVCCQNGFVTRFGGDEFIIILNNHHNQDIARDTAENIYARIAKADAFQAEISEALNEPIQIDASHRISCSIGIVISNKVAKEEDIASMIKSSDSILYRIKRNGKGTYKF